MTDWRELLIWLVAEATLLGAIILWREPKLLIPAIVLGLPIEYPETRFLGAFGSSIVAQAARALLNPGKALMVATVVAAVVRARHDPRTLVPNSSLVVPLSAMAAVIFLGLLWSDAPRPSNGTMILPLYLAFAFSAAQLIESRGDVERIVAAFLSAALLLALLAISQRAFHVFNWRGILVDSDSYRYRSNALFADPNNLARFLAISLSLAVGLVLSSGARRLTVYLCLPVLAAGAVGVLTTASRSGWLNLVLCCSVVVITAPAARWTKVRAGGGAFAALALGIGFLLVQGGPDAERLRSFSLGVDVVGQRAFLIRVGWAMFRDNPISGVGSGNYQHALIESYLDLIPSWAQTTLSHTSLVSLMAELGVLGLAAFSFLAGRLTTGLVAVFRGVAARETRLVVGWLAAGFIGVFVQSQSEGRLFDEPFLWVLFALFVAIETNPVFGFATDGTPNKLPAEAWPVTAEEGPAVRRVTRAGRM